MGTLYKQYIYMAQQVNLQVPMSKALKDDSEKFVRSLGYSSLQEWIRVQLTGIIKGTIKIQSIVSSDAYLDNMTPQYEKYLKDIVDTANIENKKGEAITVDSINSMMDVLNAD